MNDRPRFAGLSLVYVGAVAWILGVVQFFVFHLVVEFAWPEPYSWAHNNISDLGNVGCGAWGDNGRYVCSPLHTWMNTSFVLQGALLIAGLVLTGPVWRSSFMARTSRVLLFLAGLGWIAAGLAPADVNENLHVLGALAIFFCGNLGLVLFDPPASLSGKRRVRIYSLLLGAVGLVATGLFASQQYLGLGMGTMERFVVFPLQFWALLTGIYLLRTWLKENTAGAHGGDKIRGGVND